MATLDQHIVVVGADNTTVRLVEELTRAGEQLLVVTPSSAPVHLTSEIASVGAQLMVADRVREPELRRAGVGRAKAGGAGVRRCGSGHAGHPDLRDRRLDGGRRSS